MRAASLFVLLALTVGAPIGSQALAAPDAPAAPDLAAPRDPIIGDPAPALDALKLDAGVVLVDFFATWCQPCQQAMAVLDPLVRQRRLKLIVVDVGEPKERARQWFAAHPLPPGADWVSDETGATARRWGQHRFPTTFVLGDGIIRHINRGYGSGYAARLERWLAAPSH